MPGYPAFLAASFHAFGIEHYGAVVRLQVIIDLATCFLIAAGARRLLSDRAAKVAFALATLCPFTANYTATPLPETLAIFAAAVALFFALRGVQRMLAAPPWDVSHEFAVTDWIICGIGIALSIYVRPDGGLLLISIGVYLLWLALRQHDAEFLWVGVLLGLVSLLPLVPWTLRNWRVLHQFEPLAPFYAQEPGEYVPKGFDQWSKTWVLDFISVMNVEWNISVNGGGEVIDLNNIPSRAYDTAEQKQRTQQLFAQYNQELGLTPDMDRAFAQLAKDRIRVHPLRYYIALPLARLADMWLRPRTEMLNLQLDWWNWQDVPQESVVSAALGLLNLFYIVAALISFPRKLPGSAILWLFILCRSALLATLPNPEPRYTLECFPALLMLAGVGLGGRAIHHGGTEAREKHKM
jgi:4-amino-4-deoxy-L-arabinose transferase-like glycosyltransferase